MIFKKLFTIIGTLIILLFLNACNEKSIKTPVFTGVTANINKTLKVSISKKFLSNKTNDNENKNDIVSDTFGTYTSFIDEDIIITIHLINEDQAEILSLKLDEVKYQSYQFESGSNSTEIKLKVNVGSVIGVKTFEVGNIKYIDGTKIKDVIMEGKNTVDINVVKKDPTFISMVIINEKITNTNSYVLLKIELNNIQNAKINSININGIEYSEFEEGTNNSTLLLKYNIIDNCTTIQLDNINFNNGVEEKTIELLDNNGLTYCAYPEKIILPISVDRNPEIVRPFYDINATEEEQVAAIIVYNNTYITNNGVNYSAYDGNNFNVLAALSGTVSKVENSAIRGYIIEIEHEGFTTIYQSLSKVVVNVGDTVTQGNILGISGSNELDVESGNHVHFEIYQNGKHLNPVKQIGKTIDEIQN